MILQKILILKVTAHPQLANIEHAKSCTKCTDMRHSKNNGVHVRFLLERLARKGLACIISRLLECVNDAAVLARVRPC